MQIHRHSSTLNAKVFKVDRHWLLDKVSFMKHFRKGKIGSGDELQLEEVTSNFKNSKLNKSEKK